MDDEKIDEVFSLLDQIESLLSQVRVKLNVPPVRVVASSKVEENE